MAKPKTMHVTQEGPANALATNKDATQVVVAGRNVFRIYSVDDEELQFVEKMNLRVGKNMNLNFSCADVVWNPIEDNILATAATNGAVVTWNLNRSSRSKLDMVFTQHKRTVNKVSFHPLEPYILLSGSQDGTMKYFDLRNKDVVNTFYSNSESVRDVQFNPIQTNKFAAVQENGNVQLWDLRRPDRYEKQFTAHSGPVFACDWHPTERSWLATAGRDKTIKVWDLSSKPFSEQSIQTIASVSRIRWRPQRKFHIASSALVVDFSVSVWDVRRPYIPFATFNEHKDVTTGIAWRNSPRVFFSTSKDSTLYQHAFDDADRPADHANQQGLDINSAGDIIMASSDRILSGRAYGGDGCKHASAKIPAYFRRSISLGDQFPAATSTCLHLQNHSEKNLSFSWFVESAKRYVLTARSFGELCDHNAQVAASLGRQPVAQTWSMLKIIYADAVNVSGMRGTTTDAGADMGLSTLDSVFGTEVPNSDQKSVRHYSGGGGVGGVGGVGGGGGTFRHHSGGAAGGAVGGDRQPYDTSTGFSEDETETDETDQERPITDVVNEMGMTHGDFLFGDGEYSYDQMQSCYSYVLDSLTGVTDDTGDLDKWTLPQEAFQPRHELTTRSPPPDQPCMSTFSHHQGGGASVSLTGPGYSVGSSGGGGQRPAAEEMVLTVRPEALVVPLWDATGSIVEMLQRYAALGDVQMAVTVLIAVGDRLKGVIDELVQEQWFTAYIDLLTRYELWNISNQVIKMSSLPVVNQMNQQSTIVHTSCNVCCRIMQKVGWLCNRCNNLTNTCSICHHAVKGLYVWCQGCAHGGHLNHMREWLTTSRYCPTGCGHLCEYI